MSDQDMDAAELREIAESLARFGRDDQAERCLYVANMLDAIHPRPLMALRDYFAAQALTGLTLRPWNATADTHHAMVARAAYDYADAMLKERAR